MNFSFPPRNQQYFLATALLAWVVCLFLADPVRAQNTTNNFTGAPTNSLLSGTNWSLGHVPTVNEDAIFPVGAATGIRPLTAGSLTVGSFDVLATTGTFSIRNNTSTATNSTLTLGGVGDLGNGVSGTSADLLYNASGSTFNIVGPNGSTGTGVLNVLLGQSGNFDAAGTMTISASISGSGFGITKTGSGNLTLSATTNTYTAGTMVSGGTLIVANTALLNVSGNITINTNGTLQLSGSSNHIGDNLTLLMNGGTYNTAGVSETTGILSLAANSHLDLGSGSSLANLGAFNTSSTGLLTVANWTGTLILGGGTDQLLFSDSTNALLALSDIRFLNPAGLPAGTYLGVIAATQNNEIVPGLLVPIPEPGTWLAGALALGALGFTQRRRVWAQSRRAR